MKKNIFLTSLASIFFLGVCIGQNPFLKASDKASNYSGDYITDFIGINSQGSGFSSNWSETISGSASSSIYNWGQMSSKAFTLIAGNFSHTGTINLVRTFESSLSSGDNFEIDFASDSPSSGGSFNIELLDSSDNVLISLGYNHGDSNLILNDGGTDIDTGVQFIASTTYSFHLVYLGNNDYKYQINNSSFSSRTSTNSINDINKINLKCSDLGGVNPEVTKKFQFDNISSKSLTITNGSSVNVIDYDVTLPELNVESGGSLIISSDGSLTVSGQLTNNGSVTLNSSPNEYSSLIAGSKGGGGTYTYNRHVAGTNTFDLISAPFTGQTFSNLLSNNSGVIFENPSDATQYAYGPFNNNTGAYVQYDSDTDGIIQTMDAGLGFRTGTDSGATLAFTGTFETSNVTEPISLGQHNTYGRWNLIGNPFPSYLDLNHFFTDNTGNLESGATNGVYAYDGDDSDGSVWTIYNSTALDGNQKYIAPGQAFFVAASGSANVSFDTDMQSTAGTDDFLPGESGPNDDSSAQNASNSKISLALSFDGSKFAATDIYLNTKASSGLDVGYDAGTFANQAGSLGLYSFLADGSHPETKLAIQAVSNNITKPVVIPLGVNAQSGIDYTIKLKERPQQEGVFVYLKDKLDNSMTLLTDQDFSFNTSTDLQGDGRFEVHLSAFALSTFDISKAPYSMIGLNGRVQVTGELSKGDVITILDLRGRTLAKQTVNSPTQSTTVQLNGVSKGVYIGKVENNIGQYNTKFILK